MVTIAKNDEIHMCIKNICINETKFFTLFKIEINKIFLHTHTHTHTHIHTHCFYILQAKVCKWSTFVDGSINRAQYKL